jgi:Ca-activated chloride channel family protein
MSFIWPRLLLTLLLVPLLTWMYLRLARKRQGSQASLGSLERSLDSAGRAVNARRHLPLAFQILGLGLLLFGLARPQMTVKVPHIEGTVVLAFDVSNSMSADDFKPTRLDAAKAAARSFVAGQPPTVRIGVVAFGGSGLVLQPPTDDQAAILGAIDRLSPQGGTSLGEGIFASLNAIAGQSMTIEAAQEEGRAASLRIDDYSSAVALLLTDGENTEAPDPLEIAQLAADAGVRIYTIGVGTPEGAVLEVEGFNVLTQLDETALQSIASVTNGTYFRAGDEEALKEIYQNIDLQLTSRGEQMEITALAAGLGALLLIIGGMFSLFWFGRVP